MTAVPFTFSGALARPPIPSAAQTNIPIPVAAYSSQFTTKSEDVLVLTGAGTQAVDMASLSAAGAKFMSVELGTTNASGQPTAAPVNVRVNGGTDDIELSAGGFLIFGSPNPTASGILSLSLVYTQDAIVTVRVYG